jgi:uncharacterized protein (TIGR00251 family)
VIPVRHESGGLSFEVAVLPRSSRVAIEGEFDGALRVRLTAPPVDGSANKQCAEVLAKAFGVPKSAIEIVSGKNSKRKRVRILHGDASTIENELATLLGMTS